MGQVRAINPDAPRGFPQATRTLCGWQRGAALAIGVLLVAGAVTAWRTELLILNALITALYLASTVYRVLLIDTSLRHAHEIRIGADRLQAAANRDWPRYLILVPLYREAAVLPALVAALQRLEYPSQRLEIRLLIEADDSETMAVASRLKLPPSFVICPVPVSVPRTKPKACNVGLADSVADYLVIYDAEDRPDPDQLKKAVLAFAQVSTQVACIQAKLNFYNPNQNFLTRCFTAEYATWFDLCLPGLDGLQAPIPLGGTSNHFRLPVLRELGGWDEYNVTEDCDLGVRLFAAGWQTRILDSTTWEQACPSLRYWVRQRSRWVKGYIQTYLVHMRAPWRLYTQLGCLNWLHFQLLIGATPVCQLVNPVYWMLALFWILARPAGLDVFFPWPVFAMGAVCLFVGNFVFAYTSGIACVRRGFGRLTKYGLAMPLYWTLMSLGAWRGLIQLLRHPHHWDKTRHFADSGSGRPLETEKTI